MSLDIEAYAAAEQAARESEGGLGDRLNRAFGKVQFSAKLRLDLYKKLVALMKNNVPLSMALETVQRIASVNGRKPFRPQALAAAAWRKRILEGANLADAVEGWVPSRDMMILQTTEFTNPIMPMEAMIELNQAIRRIRAAFIGALAYPSVIMLIALVMLVSISTNIVPAFLGISQDIEWTGLAANFVALTDHVRALWPFYALGGVILLTIFLFSLPLWAGGLRRHLDNVPPWSIYRLWQGSGWLMSLSTMLNAGITESDALSRIEERSNRWLKARNAAIRQRVINGQELGDALIESEFDFPDFETNLTIAVYSGLSSSGEALQQIARDWVDESQARLEAQSVVLRVLALGFAGAVIAGTVLSIFDMEQQLTASLGL